MGATSSTASTVLSEMDKHALLQQAEQNIAQIVDELKNPASLVNRVFKTDRKDVINYWAEQKEIIYTLKGRPINTIANEIVKELKALGIGDESADGRYLYAYEVLPAKYKGHRPNPDSDGSDDVSATDRNGSYILPDCRAENAPIIKRLRRSITLLQGFIDELEHEHLMGVMKQKAADAEKHYNAIIKTYTVTSIQAKGAKESLDNAKAELKEYEEHFLTWDAVCEHAEAVLDKRQSVPLRLQGVFFKCFADFGMSGTASKFFVYARRIEKITSKQAHKIAHGLTQQLITIYEPNTFELAIMYKFKGVQCPECLSWRVEEKLIKNNAGVEEWRDYCYKCGKDSKPVRLILPGHEREPLVDESAVL